MKRIVPLSLFVIISLFAYAQSGFWTDEGNYDISWYGEDKLRHYDSSKGEYVWNNPDKTYYEISNAAELAGLAKLYNDGVINWYDDIKSFRLTADIDLSGHYWYPIGTPKNNFIGDFDGQNHVIKNMHLDAGLVVESYGYSMCVGLFGSIKNSTIKNTVIGRSCVIHGTKENVSAVSALVGGTFDGTDCLIENCVNYADIQACAYAGGIIGAYSSDLYRAATLTIKRCKNYGDISPLLDSVEYGRGFGGIGGNVSFSVVEECENHGTISGRGSIGGLFGDGSCKFRKCHNYGEVRGIGTSSSQIAGIAGAAFVSLSVWECTNHADISGSSYVAGLIGYSAADGPSKFISNSANYGNITAYENRDGDGSIYFSRAAGIIARFNDCNYEKCEISWCINEGNVTAYGMGTAAGIALCDGGQSVNFCVNRGEITASSAYGIGDPTVVINCGNEGDIRGIGDYYKYENSGYYCSPSAYGIGMAKAYNSYNTGLIHISGKGYDASAAGIGYDYVNNCYNIGEFDINTLEIKGLYDAPPSFKFGALSSDDTPPNAPYRDETVICGYYCNEDMLGRPNVNVGTYVSGDDMRTQEFVDLLNSTKANAVINSVTLNAYQWTLDSELGLPVPYNKIPGSLSVENIAMDTESTSTYEIGRYDINGRRLMSPTPGLNIIKYADGSCKKVIVR